MKTAESYINQIIQEELTKMLNEEKTPKEQADWRKKRKESEKPPVKTKPKTPKFFQEELKRIIQEELNELVNYMRAGTNLTTQLAPPHADLPDPSSESTDLTFDNAAENLLTTALQLAQENIGPESSIEPAKLAKVLLKMAVKKTSESDPAT